MDSYNTLIIYSIFGFLLESTIYKIKNSKRHSGISYGPVTYVYGFGVLSLNVLDKYFLMKLRIKPFWKLVITFISSVIILSLVEYLGGIILYYLFNTRLWDYSNKFCHLGKYVCLELSITWGIMGSIYLYLVKRYIAPLIKKIPKSISYIFLLIQVIDIIFVFINKAF